MAEYFNVMFAGQIVPGADPATVKANVARLFKANDAMVEKLFSGQRIAVKKAVDQATAMKYRAAMKQAGAIASLEEADEQGRPLAAAAIPVPPPAPAAVRPPPSPPPARPAAVVPPTAAAPAPQKPAASPAPVAAKPMTMAERIAALAAEQEQQVAQKAAASTAAAGPAGDGNWKVAPPGTILGQAPSAVAPVMPDISGISVARPGGELLKAEERAALAPPPVPVPDLSAIKVAPPNSDVLREEEKRVVVPVAVDISALSMAPPESDVLKEEEKRVVVPVAVDISALSIAPQSGELPQIREEKKPVNPDTSYLKLA